MLFQKTALEKEIKKLEKAMNDTIRNSVKLRYRSLLLQKKVLKNVSIFTIAGFFIYKIIMIIQYAWKYFLITAQANTVVSVPTTIIVASTASVQVAKHTPIGPMLKEAYEEIKQEFIEEEPVKEEVIVEEVKEEPIKEKIKVVKKLPVVKKVIQYQEIKLMTGETHIGRILKTVGGKTVIALKSGGTVSVEKDLIHKVSNVK